MRAGFVRRAAAPAILLAVMMSGCPVSRAEQGDAPMLRVPGFPTIPLPPAGRFMGQEVASSSDEGIGSGQPPVSQDFTQGFPYGFGARVFGSDEGARVHNRAPGRAAGQRAPAPKPPTPEEKQAQIRKALTPPPPTAVARRRSLDALYAKLAASKDAEEAGSTASVIAAIWMRSGSDTANLLMSRAEQAAQANDLPLALGVLDRLVALQPGWAEAWNKRATVRYLAGNLNGAMADVDRVLKLEPNHFAALNGMAQILQRTGFEKRALQVYRRELSIYPHQPDVERAVADLAAAVEGQGI